MDSQQSLDAIIIWRSNPHQIMETSWLRFLMSGLETKDIIGEKIPDHDKTEKVIVVTHGGKRGNHVKLSSFLEELNRNNFKIILFHLGDEFANEDISFYKYCRIVFRNYFRPEIDNSKIIFFPLGYKSNFLEGMESKNWNDRQYRWSFAGQKGKRWEMINAAQAMGNGKLVITEKFNDPGGLNTNDYAQLLCNTKVVLCPKGASLETFRLYEALEAGAIPLVEDEGGLGILRENLSIRGISKLLNQRIPFVKKTLIKALKVESYWLSAFSSNFPCPRIFEWDNLPEVLARIPLRRKSELTQNWWRNHKKKLVNKVTQCIHNT